MGNISITFSPDYIRKVYKVATADNEQKFLAFKKITYSKDNEGVIF